MAININWKWTGRIAGEPDTSISGLLPVEAYEKAEVPLPKDAADLEVTLPPGVIAFAISAASYGDDTHRISYTVNGTGEPLELTAPLVLVGAAAVGRFCGPEPSPSTALKALASLKLTSTLAADTTIDIFTARNTGA